MESASNLLDEFKRRGMYLWSDGNQIRLRSPPGAASPADLDRLRTHKLELITLLERTKFPADAPLRPRPPNTPVPLTARQRAVWIPYTDQSGLRITQTIHMRLTGTLNLRALHRSLKCLFIRHEALRTRFITTDGVPRHHVDAAPNDCLNLVDLSHLRVESARAEATHFVQHLIGAKPHLDAGPFFIATLFRLQRHEHLLVLKSDHMITDGLSLDILSREIREDYRSIVSRRTSTLPAPPVQFADYAVWEERTYASWLNQHGAYWKTRLANAPRTQLPLHKISEDPAPRCETTTISFGEPLSDALRRVARKESIPISLVVLAIYVASVAEWSQQREVLVACISNGRSTHELAAAVGWFSHPLLLRLEVPHGDRFVDLVKRTKAELYAAYDHDDLGRVGDLIPNCTTDAWFNWIDRPGSCNVERPWSEGPLSVHTLPLPIAHLNGFSTIFSDSGREIRVEATYPPLLIPYTSILRHTDTLISYATMCASEYASLIQGSLRATS
jgi:hypothetical protein